MMDHELSNNTNETLKEKMSSFSIDGENFEFTTINDGLGFNKTKKKNATTSVSDKHLRNLQTNTIKNKTVPKVQNEAYINLFEQKEEEKVLETDKQNVVEDKEYRSPSIVLKFGCWLIDVTIILFMMALTAFFLFYTTGIQWKMVTSSVFTTEVSIFATSMFALYYLIYFSILDISETSSIGKLICNIKVISASEQRFGFTKAFLRSFISLLSIPLVGLPVIMKLHDFVTGTMVVKND